MEVHGEATGGIVVWQADRACSNDLTTGIKSRIIDRAAEVEVKKAKAEAKKNRKIFLKPSSILSRFSKSSPHPIELHILMRTYSGDA